MSERIKPQESEERSIAEMLADPSVVANAADVSFGSIRAVVEYPQIMGDEVRALKSRSFEDALKEKLRKQNFEIGTPTPEASAFIESFDRHVQAYNAAIENLPDGPLDAEKRAELLGILDQAMSSIESYLRTLPRYHGDITDPLTVDQRPPSDTTRRKT